VMGLHIALKIRTFLQSGEIPASSLSIPPTLQMTETPQNRCGQ
jgi:hypothetical protein